MANEAKIIISAENKISGAVKEAEKAMESFSQKMQKIGNKMKDVGSKMTLFLTTPLVALGGASIKLASDMAETQNKIAVVFGDSAEEINEWSKGTIKNIGIASQTALDSVALFGDMATSMGLSTEEAKKMSLKLTELTGDMASFKNIRIEVGATALKSIFTGETESLKGLGIVMTQANLSAFALSQGIEKNIEDMTQAELVNLRYQYVLNVTSNSQGDFARTSDSAANQMRTFKERVKELGIEFGENLLPAFNNIISVAISFIQWFGSLSESTQTLILGLGALVAAAGPVIYILGQIIVVTKALGIAFAFVAATPGAQLILLLGALVTSGYYLISNWDKVKDDWKWTWIWMKDATQPIVDAINGFIMSIVDAIKSVIEWLGKMLQKTKDIALEIASLGFAETKTFNASLPVKQFAQSGLKKFAKGGMVYAQDGFFAKGTDTVPAMLSPGEIVLNAAQQRNLLSKLGGINIVIYGDVTGQDIIDRVGDALTKKMFNHSPVV